MKKPAIRQVKGPGMNKGLKKPRHGYIPKPKEHTPSRAAKKATAQNAETYLPPDSVKKPRKRGKPPGSLI